MSTTKKPSRLGEQLRRRGFDETTYIRSGFGEGYYRVRCSQCEALVINGLACHERGCPNNKHRSREDD